MRGISERKKIHRTSQITERGKEKNRLIRGFIISLRAQLDSNKKRSGDNTSKASFFGGEVNIVS